EEEARRAGDEAGGRDRQKVVPVVLHRQDRGRVRADRHERAVTERDLAGRARQDVQADDGDQVDADLRQLERPEIGHDPRQHRDDDRPDGEGEESRARHTRLTTTRPNSPAGRTSSTPSRIARATGRRSSSVTKPTSVPSRLIATPSARPPTTAP